MWTHLLPPISPGFSYLPNRCWVFTLLEWHCYHCQLLMIAYPFCRAFCLSWSSTCPCLLKTSAQYFPTLISFYLLRDTQSEDLSHFIFLVTLSLEISAFLFHGWELSRPLDRCWWEHSFYHYGMVTALPWPWFLFSVWPVFFSLPLSSCSVKHAHLELSATKGTAFENLPIWCFFFWPTGF